jgi:hypothetical protein
MGILKAGHTLLLVGICVMLFFPIISSLNGDANAAIDNSPNLAYGGLAKMGLNLLGVAFIVGGLFMTYRDMQGPDDIYNGDEGGFSP